VLVVVSMLVARGAAAEPANVRWWLEARPWTCNEHLSALGREVALACDATGGRCNVAPDERTATMRATLRCVDADRWLLEATTAEGERLWNVDLAGEPSDRLRRAAVWIARNEEPARAEPSPSPVVRLEAPGARPAEVPGAEAPAASPSAADRRGGLSFAARGTYGYARPELGSNTLMAGARAEAALALRNGVRLGATGTFDSSLDAPAMQMLGGIALSLGAPWSDDVVGLEIGGGVGAQRMEYDAYGESLGTRGVGYGEVAIVLQWPRVEGPRPWFAIQGAKYIGLEGDEGLISTTLALNIGIAWSAW
jgi:hypothetical protein